MFDVHMFAAQTNYPYFSSTVKTTAMINVQKDTVTDTDGMMSVTADVFILVEPTGILVLKNVTIWVLVGASN